MPQFLLFLYDDPTQWRRMSPEEIGKIAERYHAWGHKPFVKGGERLTEDLGRVIRKSKEDEEPKPIDGPYSETKEVLGGYYKIEAADYDEAVKLSLDNPHLDFGTIEVRQLYVPTE